MIKDKKAREAELKEKYGDTRVAVVPASLVACAKLPNGFTKAQKGIFDDGVTRGELRHVISNRMTMMPRYLAELDPSFKQMIPYVVVINDPTGDIFVTRRLAGDERLKGKASIGIGGHIEDGESLMDGMYRELKEEIGLAKEDVAAIHFRGYINDDATEVGSVHLGLVYELHTPKFRLHCLEKDTLVGTWGSVSELMKYFRAGVLESWSEIAYQHLFLR